MAINPPFDKLVFKKQVRYQIKPKHNIKTIGYDTETRNGQAFLISDSIGRHCNPQSFDDILYFLCCDTTRSHLGFWFNLKYDFQAILKWLPPEDWKTILKKGELIYKDGKRTFVLNYIPKKFLAIALLSKGKKKRKWVFYDISQFFRTSLDDAGEKYLNMRKMQHSYDLKNILPHQFLEQEMKEYCQRDAVMTVLLADHWIDICHNSNLYPSNFCSPASIASQYFRKEIKIPTINKFFKPQYSKYLKIVWESVSGAFISAFRRGYFENVYEYDINSAYPYQMSLLPDLNKGRFIYREKYVPKKAIMGWVRVLITITPDDTGFFHPCFPIMRDNLPNYYPVGTFPASITLLEYEQLKHYFEIQLIDGFYFLSSNPHYLFKDVVTERYNERKKTKDKNIDYFNKTVLNGIYGKFLEKIQEIDDEKEDYGKWKTGQLFNPFYASYILAGTRVQLFKALEKAGPENIIACFTDSIFTTKKLDLGCGSLLGDWDFVQKGEMLIVGCGVYSVKGEKKTKSKLRGFNTTSKEEKSLFHLIPQQKDNEEIKVNITQNIAPLSSIIEKRPDDMNLIIDTQKTIKINFDTKRLWDYNFKCAGELLDKQSNSLPIFHLP